LGGAIAEKLGAGFVPVRKPGKLPWETVEQSYELEYGADSLEAHVDAFPEGARALIVDDVIATGGTALATKDLAAGRGGAGRVGCGMGLPPSDCRSRWEQAIERSAGAHAGLGMTVGFR
jgi:adenine phosphoribosyltransferase